MSSNDGGAASTAVDYDPFAGEALARVVSTTAPQREIWLAATLEREASLAYNESVSLRLSGALDVGALQRALQLLLDRHEALRGTLSADGKELYIAEHLDLRCDVVDLAARDPAARDAAVASMLQRAVTTPFDLEHGPLVRAELLRLAADNHLLVFTAHHIVCDGWSFGVIVRDLAAIYAQLTGNGAPLTLLRIFPWRKPGMRPARMAGSPNVTGCRASPAAFPRSICRLIAHAHVDARSTRSAKTASSMPR